MRKEKARTMLDVIAEVDRNLRNQEEIDRAMNLMSDTLRFQEVQYDMNSLYFDLSDIDADIDMWIRYLEKVEQELEANNE